MSRITLSTTSPIKSGGEKLVFWHPGQQGHLIKVINTRYFDYMHKQWPVMMRLQRLAHYWSYLRELTEHIAARANGVPDLHHLQNITGLVDTDLGLGLVTEAVTRPDGQLAWTLGDLIEQGRYDQTQQAAFERFCQWLSDAPLIIRDLSVHNLVWQEDGGYFVVIDGVGGKIRPTLRSFSDYYNRRSNRQKVAKLKERIARMQAKQPGIRQASA